MHGGSPGAEAGENRGWPARARALLVRAATSLRGQILLLVLAATGVTALLSAWTSTATIERYLGSRIEEQFPALLSGKAREVELWYQQARFNVETFARSETVQRNVPRLGAAGDAVAREELRIYLDYIRDRFDYYIALSLLDPEGEEQLRTGHEVALPDAVRAGAQGLQQARVHGLLHDAGRAMQVASAPVPGAGGATLHAVIDLASLDAALGDGIERAATDVLLLDADGRYVAGTLETLPPGGRVHRGPAPDGDGGIQTYVNSRGQRVIGGARAVRDDGWTLAIEQDYEAAFEPVGALVTRVVWADALIGLVLVLVAGRVVVSATRPVGALASAAQRVAAGDTEVRVHERRGASELVRLTHAFNQMTEHLHAQRRALEQRNDDLQQLSMTDGLTGTYNHRYFREQLPVEIKRADRIGRELALIMLDIDDFKAINDTYGHAVGDQILRAVADALGATVRDTDLLARYGGEEFVVLAEHDDRDGALVLADKLRRAVAALAWPPEGEAGERVALTVSAGVALHEGDAEALFRNADAALYAAKAGGKNRVAFGDADGAAVHDPGAGEG
ncbi:MAG: diguanylate cyclase [Halofilum sp. (in: g-proteobacteria)]|nr:diguanylate cyclase [Halofilum sp. (in: g-proteobacteria)]